MSLASNAATRRYNAKTYKNYMLKLRKAEDAELIARIEALKASGLQTTAAIKKLINREETHDLIR